MEKFETKKSLGQNFLKSERALREIIEAGDITPGDLVLEVGPGEGALTTKLLNAGALVVAVEKDDRLVPILSEKFGSNSHFTLIHGDILELSPSEGPLGDTLATKSYKIIANLPYYITGAFFQHIFESSHPAERMVVMLQKEVAQRIVAKDGKESILSQSIRAYGAPKYISTVPRGAFAPAPTVDSAVILVSDVSKRFFETHHISEKMFFTAVKLGFAHKRKLVKSNLGFSEQELAEAGIAPKTRAEEVTQECWARAAQIIEKKQKSG